MGDIADSMIDGTFDYESGEYLGEGPGYPRTAGDMYYEKAIKRISKKRPNNNRFVIYNFLRQKGVHSMFDKNRTLQLYANAHLNVQNLDKICELIRESDKSWEQFKEWIKTI